MDEWTKAPIIESQPTQWRNRGEVPRFFSCSGQRIARQRGPVGQYRFYSGLAEGCMQAATETALLITLHVCLED